jgi:Flp pilus assembly protein TadD
MRKRSLIIALAALVLINGAAGFWTTKSFSPDDDATQAVAAGKAPKTRKGNAFARALKAPFKGLARLFGGGKSERERIVYLGKEAPRSMNTNSAVTVTVTGPRSAADYRSKATAASEKHLAVEPPPPALATSAVTPLPESPRLPGAISVSGDQIAAGRALLESGRLDEAIVELSIAASVGPNLIEANNLLGVAYDRKGQHDMAREAYERVLRAAPDDPQTLNNLGYSYYLSGDYRTAINRLKRAAKLAPHDPRVLNNLALAQCGLGKFDDAYKTFARAAGEFAGRIKTAEMLERAGRERDAIKHLEAAQRLQPTSATVLRRLADLYQRTGHRDEAVSALRVLASTGK